MNQYQQSYTFQNGNTVFLSTKHPLLTYANEFQFLFQRDLQKTLQYTYNREFELGKQRRK
jgi:hypothetical protein